MVQKAIKYIKKMLIPPSLEREAFDAYFYRLPDDINVSWTRDGKFIVGSITDGGHMFLTQAKSGDEFIEMVNDAVYTFHDIPEDYRDAIRMNRAYNPNLEERKKLEDVRVGSSSIVFRKDKKVLRAA